MEIFFGHLQAEMYYGKYFASVDHFVAELDDYIYSYNTKRVQEQLEGMTPKKYQDHALKNQAV